MSTLQTWDANPLGAFKEFLASDAFNASSRRLGKAVPTSISARSAAVYTYMFQKFATWLAGQRPSFSQLSEQDLLRFIGEVLQKGDQKSRITQRYLRLLERCFDHLNIIPNPGAVALKLATANSYLGHDKRMTVLDPEQVAQFVSALPQVPLPTSTRSGRKPSGWKRRRDRAMQATMLFSGLRVAETIGLQLDEVDDSFGEGDILLRITPAGKHDTSYAHDTILRGYGADALRAWLQERQALELPGTLVFPGNVQGKPMSKTTVYTHVQATFARAGIQVDRNGGRTLRNSFAAGELRDGRPPAEVKKYLGLALERSTEPYAQAAGRTGKKEA